MTDLRNNGRPSRTACPARTESRRVVFVVAPGTEILDLVGPLQVFARAAEMFSKQNPGSPPIYSVEVITTSPRRSFVTNCGLRITAHKTFREVHGKIDTLLIAGGSAIERDEINPEVVRWLRKIAGRIRRIGSVCTGAMLLARAGLLNGRQATTHWNWCEILIKRAPRAACRSQPNIRPRRKCLYLRRGHSGNGFGADSRGRRPWFAAGAASSSQPGALLAPARRTIAIQRSAVLATDRPKTVARAGVMGARQLEQTAHRPGAGGAGRDESSQFRPGLH